MLLNKQMRSEVSFHVSLALLTATCLSLVNAACGSSGDGTASSGQSGAGGVPGGEGGSPHAGDGGAARAGAANGGAIPAAGASGSNSGSAGAVAGGGSGTTPAQLFPLAVGNRWTFAVTGTDAFCPAGMHDATVAATGTESGELAFDFRDYCQATESTYLRVYNGELLQQQGEWARALAVPLQDGYSWMFTANYQLTWHFVGAVTVAAGTFQNCWQRSNMSSAGDVLGSRTYCPGVGPVKATYSDNEASLTSYLLK